MKTKYTNTLVSKRTKIKDAKLKMKIFLNRTWWTVINISPHEQEDYINLHLSAPFGNLHSGPIKITFKKEDEYFLTNR